MIKIILFMCSLLFLLAGCKKNDSDQQELYNDAVFQYRSREFLKAIDILKKINDSEYCKREMLLGSSYWELNNFQKAIEHYQNYQRKKCANDFLVFNNKGDSFVKLGKIDSALYNFKEAEKIDPTNNVILFNLGFVHYIKQNDSVALSYFNKNLFNSPYKIDYDSYGMAEKILLKQNKPEVLIDLTDSLLGMKDKDQDYFRLLLRRVYIEGDLGNWKKMRTEITKILNISKLAHANLLNAHYNRYLASRALKDTAYACKDYFILTKELKSREIENVLNCN